MNNIALAYYRDEVEQELLLFKNENSSAIYRWLHYIDEHFQEIFNDIKVDYIVRALSSHETYHENILKPLDIMGQLLARKFNAKYVTDILTKERTQQLKYAGNGYNRKNILDHKYQCNLKDLKKAATYLIIDDVSTTGTTFNEIIRAINVASNYQANTYCFSLVKTLWNKDYTNDKQTYNINFYKKLVG